MDTKYKQEEGLQVRFLLSYITDYHD